MQILGDGGEEPTCLAGIGRHQASYVDDCVGIAERMCQTNAGEDVVTRRPRECGHHVPSAHCGVHHVAPHRPGRAGDDEFHSFQTFPIGTGTSGAPPVGVTCAAFDGSPRSQCARSKCSLNRHGRSVPREVAELNQANVPALACVQAKPRRFERWLCHLDLRLNAARSSGWGWPASLNKPELRSK